MYADGVIPVCSLKASMNFDLEAKPALEEMASMVIFLESPESIISIA
jgi:hypothetical protein